MKYLFITSLLMLIVSCGSENSNTENKHPEGELINKTTESEDEHAHEDEDSITFNSEQAEELGFQITAVEEKVFSNIVRTSGIVLDAQGEKAIAIATVPGIVSFGRVRLADGMRAKDGQTMMYIQSEGTLQDNIIQRIAETRTELALLDSNIKRAEDLGNGFISERELTALKAEQQQIKIKLDNLTDGFSDKGKSIASPIGGFVKNLYVTEGQYVNVGDQLFEVSRNKRLQLVAEVPLKDYSKIKGNLNAKFKSFYSDKNYDLKELNGKVISVGRSTENNFFVKVTFEFDNKIDIITGSFVEVYIINNSSSSKEIVIPFSSLVEEQGVYSVYVKTCVDSYEKRFVNIGDNNLEDVVILDGLHVGDNIVSRGGYFLKLASMSNVAPAAHNH